MVEYLEESLKHTPLLGTETVLDWMSNLANYSGKNSNHIKISELGSPVDVVIFISKPLLLSGV
jgi:hypothetical protein